MYGPKNFESMRNVLDSPEFKHSTVSTYLHDQIVIGECYNYCTAEYNAEGPTWVKPIFENMRPFNLFSDNYDWLVATLPVDFAACRKERGEETLLSIDGSGISGRHLNTFVPDTPQSVMTIWNSPVIATAPIEDLLKLHVDEKPVYDKKTRYKIKQAADVVKDFHVSMHPGYLVNYSYLATCLAHRWQFDDYTHALGQLLYAACHPKTLQVSLSTIHDHVADMLFIVEHGVALHQATIIDPKYAQSFKNYGAVLYAASIEVLAKAGIEWLDPSCVTNPFSENSIDVYKRLFVNTNNYRYSFYMSNDIDGSRAPFFNGTGWETVETQVMDKFANRTLMWHGY